MIKIILKTAYYYFQRSPSISPILWLSLSFFSFHLSRFKKISLSLVGRETNVPQTSSYHFPEISSVTSFWITSISLLST